jgi:hypothetical protein
MESYLSSTRLGAVGEGREKIRSGYQVCTALLPVIPSHPPSYYDLLCYVEIRICCMFLFS